jgi:hypothetical protein
VRWEAFVSLHPSVVQSPWHGEPHPWWPSQAGILGQTVGILEPNYSFGCSTASGSCDYRPANCKKCFTFWKKTCAMINVALLKVTLWTCFTSHSNEENSHAQWCVGWFFCWCLGIRKSNTKQQVGSPQSLGEWTIVKMLVEKPPS